MTQTTNSIRKNATSSRAFAAALCFAVLNLLLVLTDPISKIITHQESGTAEKTASPDPRRLALVPSFEWWRMQAFMSEQKAPQVVLLGSSQLMYSLFLADADFTKKSVDMVSHSRSHYMEHELKQRFKADSPSCFNFGLPGAMVSDDYMIVKGLFNKSERPSLVVLTLALRDFIDNRVENAGSTPTFTLLKPYVATDEIIEDAIPHAWERSGYLAERSVYLWRKRLDMRLLAEDQAKEGVGSFVGAMAPGSTAASKQLDPTYLLDDNKAGPGFRKGVALLHPDQPVTFTDNSKEYKKAYKTANNLLFGREEAFFHRVLGLLNQEGIKVLMVNMPVTPDNMALMPAGSYERYRSLLSQASKQYGVKLIDLNDGKSFGTNDYFDTVHLNGHGGKKVVDRLVREISQSREIASRLAGGTI